MTDPSAAWHDYDYAFIRVVPRVPLEAFVNVGVVLHSRTAGFLGIRTRVPHGLAYPPGLDAGRLARHLAAYEAICRGGADAGPIGVLPPSERFHWLTAPRSAVLQPSGLHPGRSHDPERCLDRLFAQAVGLPAGETSGGA